MTEKPEVHPQVFVAPTAQIFGNVQIGPESSIWHNVVIRAESHFVRVGRYTNLQDFVMIHIGYENATEIGDFCSITHNATIHGCTVGDHCLVGISAVIMDHAVIGEGSIVAGGAFVTEGSVFPPHSIIAGVPAKQIAERDSAHANRMNAWMYQRNAEFTRRGDYRAWSGAEYKAWHAAKSAEIETDQDL